MKIFATAFSQCDPLFFKENYFSPLFAQHKKIFFIATAAFAGLVAAYLLAKRLFKGKKLDFRSLNKAKG